MRAELYPSSTIITKVGLFYYVSFFSADTLHEVRISCKMNNIAKLVNSATNDAGAMEFCLIGGWEDGEYNSLCFVEIF